MIKNTASQVINFVVIDASTGAAVTSGTVNVFVTIDGGTQTTGTGATPVHEGNGQWSYVPSQAETNGDSIGFLFTHTSGIPASLQIYTVTAAVSDAVATATSSASNAAHMSKLKAVNQMLRSINEQAVSSLSSGQLDAERAQDVLDETSRRIQVEGWHANTRQNVTLTTNASNQFAVGVNALSVDSVNPRGVRPSAGNIANSRFYNVMLKRAADDSKFLLYDVDRDSETWTDITTITVSIIEFLNFEHLPPALQVYIYKAAAHEFQKDSVASQVLYEFTLEDVQTAMATAIQDDAKNEDSNVLENRAAWSVVQRYNPLY